MKKTKVMTDSSSGISQEEAKLLEIDVIPMPIVIRGQEYLDGIDLFYEQSIDFLLANEQFKTSQPLPRDILAKWEAALAEYDEVVYIPISSGISGSCINAYTLAAEYDGRVIVVDAKTTELPLRYTCYEAKRMVDHGMSALEIKEVLERDFKETFACIVPETVETLKRGGRITPAAAALAGFLKISPVLKLEFGNIDLHAKIRTLKRAYQEAMEAPIRNVENKDDYHWLILQCGFSDEEMQQFKKNFEELVGQEVHESRFTPIVMSHVGNHTIGFGRCKKYKLD